jgi:hypothetical protein
MGVDPWRGEVSAVGHGVVAALPAVAQIVGVSRKQDRRSSSPGHMSSRLLLLVISVASRHFGPAFATWP